ncbi:MAG: mobilization protein [Alphaproteobacteria bacterium]|nr:mobilization protein [Alphaproteobacteria bacterium]
MAQKIKTIEDKLSALREKESQLKAQLRDAQAREKAQDRKNDTRRKILMGALCKKMISEDPQSSFSLTLLRLIDEHLTAPKDRALFGLPPLDDKKPEAQDT